MKNPFRYGSVVRGDAFCNRKDEVRDLRRAMENAERLFVYSERRLGKTSLVRHTLEKLPKKEFVCVYVDLWPTDAEASFVTTTARAIVEAHATTSQKLLEAARALFTRLVPSVTLDDAGKPKLTLDLSRSGGPELELTEVLEAPAKIAEATGRRVVVVFDECQRLLEYGSDLVERRLRSVIQHHSDVAYIFLGSRKHLIQSMLRATTRSSRSRRRTGSRSWASGSGTASGRSARRTSGRSAA
jgi:AAA+ ATPase superfamily predicted ATPase